MDDIEAKLIAARMLRKQSFGGPIISHALFEDHQQRIIEAGATHTYLTMTQAGKGLAGYAVSALGPESSIDESEIRLEKSA